MGNTFVRSALYLLLLLIPHIGSGQSIYPCTGFSKHYGKKTVFDTARYVVSYIYSTYRDPEQPEQRDSDEVWVEIGDSVTNSYSRPRWVNDSIQSIAMQKGAQSYDAHCQWCMRETILCLYSHQKEIIWTYHMLTQEKLYWYEDLPEFPWVLHPESRDILGYTCRKATVDFRGRHYTAWYAPDIPLPYGPWSFHGLPGLILEIKDDTDRVSFVAKGFEVAHPGWLIQWYADWYIKSTREKARKLIDLMHRRPCAYAGEDYVKRSSLLRSNPNISFKHTWVELE